METKQKNDKPIKLTNQLQRLHYFLRFSVVFKLKARQTIRKKIVLSIQSGLNLNYTQIALESK